MRVFSFIPIVFLAAGVLTPAFAGEQSASLPFIPSTPTPSPPPSPSPSPSPSATPPPLSLELYFQRAAKIIPEPAEKNYEIVEEVPFLTQRDFSGLKVNQANGRYSLVIALTPPGRRKLTEAGMGNVGRTVVVVLNGTTRNTFKLTSQTQPLLHLQGNFSRREAFALTEQVNTRPSPTPTPAAIPTPSPRQKISVY